MSGTVTKTIHPSPELWAQLEALAEELGDVSAEEVATALIGKGLSSAWRSARTCPGPALRVVGGGAE